MKRANFSAFGAPEDVLTVVEDAAAPLAAGEVRVEIEASPVHIADLKFMTGALPFPGALPATPGCEAIGRVIAAGEGVAAYTPGSRVFLPLVVGGVGGWRQQASVPAASVTPAPEGDAAQLCLTPVNGATAYALLRGVTPLEKGDWLIHNAANSNCGRYLTVLAHRAGVKTVGVVRRAEVVEDLKNLGADVVLVDGPDLAERVKAATGGAPIRLGIDAVAGDATQRLADSVADHAILLAYGLMSGEPCKVRPETLFMRQLTLKGFLTNYGLEALSPEELAEMQREIPALAASGVLNAKIATTYTLDEVVDACRHAARTGAERDGKVIILPNG